MWLRASVANPAPAASDEFGYSVAGVGSDRFVVGAWYDDTDASDAGPLPPELVTRLRAHRWDREPTEWSQ